MNNTIAKQYVDQAPVGTHDPKHLEWALILLVELASGLNDFSVRKQLKATKFEIELYGASAIKDSFSKWYAKSGGKNFSKEELLAMISRIKYELELRNKVN